MTTVNRQAILANRTEWRQHIEILIGKYPVITDEEKSEVLAFIKTAPAIDTALLSCNERIADQLKAFKSEYRTAFGFGFNDFAAVMALMGILAVIVYFLWDFGI